MIHQKNQGVSVARNVGIENSTGEYLLFVDSDDFVDKQYIEVLYNNLISVSADLSICTILDVHEGFINYFKFSNNIKCYNNRQAIEHFGMINKKNFYTIYAKLVKRSIVEKNRFPIGRAFSEDRAVLYKWYFAANKIVETDAVLYFYNIIEGSAIHRKYDYYMLGELDTEREMLNFFKENNFYELYHKFLYNYVDEIGRQYNEILSNFNDKATAKKLKKQLKQIVKKEKYEHNLCPKNNPVCYNVLYPKTMRIYWTCKGLVSKIKKG